MGRRWAALAFASNLALASTAIAAEPSAEPGSSRDARTRRFELSVGFSAQVVPSPFGVSSNAYSLGVWTLGARISARWWMHEMLALELRADLGAGKASVFLGSGESQSQRRGLGADLIFGLPTTLTPLAGLGVGWSSLHTDWDNVSAPCWFGACDSGPPESGKTATTTWLLTPMAGIAYGRGAVQGAMLFRAGLPVHRDTSGTNIRHGNGVVVDVELRVAARF
ncbi:MAG: hypothetical protein R3F39_14205 [Myxococcota bacterium]